MKTTRLITLGLLGLGLILAGCTKAPPTAAQVRAEWTTRINRTIPDPVRAEKIATLVGQLLDAQQAKAAALDLASQQLAAANADYHATPEQLQAIYHDYEARQRETMMAFKDGLFAIRRQVSAKEWAAIID